MFAWKTIAGRIRAVYARIPNLAFALVFILPNVGPYDQAKGAVFARPLLIVLALTNVSQLAVGSIAELVAHAFVRSFRVDALAVA